VLGAPLDMGPWAPPGPIGSDSDQTSRSRSTITSTGATRPRFTSPSTTPSQDLRLSLGRCSCRYPRRTATRSWLDGRRADSNSSSQNLDEDLPDPAPNQRLEVVKVPWGTEQLCSRIGDGVCLRCKPKLGLGLRYPENTPFFFFNKPRDGARVILADVLFLAFCCMAKIVTR
jgi:hypothetical protein